MMREKVELEFTHKAGLCWLDEWVVVTSPSFGTSLADLSLSLSLSLSLTHTPTPSPTQAKLEEALKDAGLVGIDTVIADTGDEASMNAMCSKAVRGHRHISMHVLTRMHLYVDYCRKLWS
jgi:hypothetical protein